jgi:hypothetical protein
MQHGHGSRRPITLYGCETWSHILKKKERNRNLVKKDGIGRRTVAVKLPEREADLSLPTSAKVKKMWIYTSTPPYALMAQCLIS